MKVNKINKMNSMRKLCLRIQRNQSKADSRSKKKKKKNKKAHSLKENKLEGVFKNQSARSNNLQSRKPLLLIQASHNENLIKKKIQEIKS